MWVILLEAAGALVLILLIVWWTMFSGRDKGEPRQDQLDEEPSAARGESDDAKQRKDQE